MMFNLHAAMFLIMLACGLFGHAEEADSGGDLSAQELDDARALLEAFKMAVVSDPERAQEIHEAFMTQSDLVKRGYGRHLETEWLRMKREITNQANLNRSKPSREMTQQMKQKVRDQRKLLSEIRGIDDDEAMKQRLATEGWAALEFLESRYKRGNFDAPENEALDAEFIAKRDTAIRIGEFRYELFKTYGIAKPNDMAAELGIGRDDSGEDGPTMLKASADDRRVLEKNEALAKEIPKEEADGIQQLNEWRIALGLNALLIDPKLCDACRDHSKDMAQQGFFAHESPVKGKETPWKRAENFGTQARSENIAINDGARASNRAWFHSPGHHKNMFATDRTYVGLGGHGRHWTQKFR